MYKYDIYVINLKKDIKRYNTLKKEMKQFQFKRFEAINGNELDIERLKKNKTLTLKTGSFPYSKLLYEKWTTLLGHTVW